MSYLVASQQNLLTFFYSFITGGIMSKRVVFLVVEQQIGQQCQTFFHMVFDQW